MVSEPPRPMVVMSPLVIDALESGHDRDYTGVECRVQSLGLDRRRCARVRARCVVSTRTWLPVKERAGTPRSHQRHREQRDRHLLAGGEQHVHFACDSARGQIAAARSTSRSVESPIAETTTAMRSPRARTAATCSATRWMSSTEPTEVPPYFWTMSPR